MDARALRLAPAAGAAWVVAAVLVLLPAAAPATAFALWAVTAGTLLAAATVRRGAARSGHRRALPALTIVAVALAFAAATASAVAFTAPAREAAVGPATHRALQVVVSITGKVERTAAGFRADAVVEQMHAGGRMLPAEVPVTLLLDRAAPELDVGARLQAPATAFAADPGERAVLVVRIEGEGAVVEPATGILAVASELRRSLARATAGLPEPGAGLIPGLAVGDTGGVDPALDETMTAASLTHLTAVSGANCAIIVGLAFVIAGSLGASRAVRVLAGLGALGGFVLLVTPEPSVVRAAVMAAVSMLALLIGRRGAGVAVLSVAVAGVLVFDPWLALSLGFALSVAATAALLVLAAPIARGLGRSMPRPLAAALAVPLSAQLVCGPLIVLIEPRVSVYGVVANLLAAPAAPVATVLGLAACLTAPLPLLQSGLAGLAWLPAAWIAATAEAIVGLPGSTLPWLDGIPGLVALGLLGTAATVLLVPPGRRRMLRRVRGLSGLILTAVVGVAAGSVVVVAVVVPMTTPGDWRIAMCDVGQGDAVLVRSGGHTMLVDTGPEPAPTAACLERLGIDRVDVLVITHFDADHVGGIDALVGRAGLVLHGPVGDAHDDRDLRSVGAGSLVEARAGMRGMLGDAVWRVLWPAASADRAVPPGNDASVVVEVTGPDLPRTLLLGDLGADAQRALRVSGVLRPPYGVVKLAHHGSADQDGALYDAIGADLALIPVGAGNDYGHPREEALAIVAATGAVVARTDRDGMVLVGAADDAARITLWRERAPPGVDGAR